MTDRQQKLLELHLLKGMHVDKEGGVEAAVRNAQCIIQQLIGMDDMGVIEDATLPRSSWLALLALAQIGIAQIHADELIADMIDRPAPGTSGGDAEGRAA